MILLQALLREAKDPLSDWLDFNHGASITDNSIFAKLPQHWETQFHQDMDALNVRTSGIITFYQVQYMIKNLLLYFCVIF